MCEICSNLTITPFSSVSIVDFEQVNISWESRISRRHLNVLTRISQSRDKIKKLIVNYYMREVSSYAHVEKNIRIFENKNSAN